jgi:DNA invertase Pin-like site-specific DNA recombinase
MKDNSVLNKPVGIWIRVSTEDQAKGESPEHHEERARSYAKSKGWQVKELYGYSEFFVANSENKLRPFS